MLPEQNTSSFLPPFVYGTAWKENNTQRLVLEALNMGFSGIDTANQRKHYFEEGVGAGIQAFFNASEKTRGDIFLQTKFTSVNGQDDRKPYNESDSLTNQVKHSFKTHYSICKRIILTLIFFMDLHYLKA